MRFIFVGLSQADEHKSIIFVGLLPADENKALTDHYFRRPH
jgi:G:T/U-mismatch repair DNA glycosylase